MFDTKPDSGPTNRIGSIFRFRDVIGAGIGDTTSNAPDAKQVLESQEGCGYRGSPGSRIIGGTPIKQVRGCTYSVHSLEKS
jgi:hypothetical protein